MRARAVFAAEHLQAANAKHLFAVSSASRRTLGEKSLARLIHVRGQADRRPDAGGFTPSASGTAVELIEPWHEDALVHFDHHQARSRAGRMECDIDSVAHGVYHMTEDVPRVLNRPGAGVRAG